MNIKLWNQIREQVKLKQNNRCYLCNKEVKGRSANVHHIIDRRFKDLELAPFNLVLLCPRCHKFDKFSVHNTSIYFSEILRKREPERYELLINYLLKNSY